MGTPEAGTTGENGFFEIKKAEDRRAQQMRRLRRRVVRAQAALEAAEAQDWALRRELLQVTFSSDEGVAAYIAAYAEPPPATLHEVGYFTDAYDKAKQVVEETQGAFHPRAVWALSALRRMGLPRPPEGVEVVAGIWFLPGWRVQIADLATPEVWYPEADGPRDAAEMLIHARGYRPGLSTQRLSFITRRTAVVPPGWEGDIHSLEDRQTHAGVVPAQEPRCIPGMEQHFWRNQRSWVGGLAANPGVFASLGGGLVVAMGCDHCGCGRVIDATAVDTDGALYEKTTYDPTAYRDRVVPT